MAKGNKSLMPIDTGEWIDSPRINSISYELRGIWLTLLCYMWESPTRGMMIQPNGKPYTKAGIAILLGLKDTAPIDRLLEVGLLSLDETGRYYNYQMLRSDEISRKRRIAGAKGGENNKARMLRTATPELVEQPVKVIEPPPKTPTLPLEIENEPVVDEPPELTQAQKEKIAKSKKYKYADNVTLTRDEYAKLCAEHGEDATRRMIEILDNYKGQNGKRYKSDYRAILNWVVNRYNDEIVKYGARHSTTTLTSKSAGGVTTPTGYASGTDPFTTGASPQSGDAPEKNFAERF